MAFDASRGSDAGSEPRRGYQEEPIDSVDWAMRVAVFGPLLALYSFWIWTVTKTAFNALVGNLGADG